MSDDPVTVTTRTSWLSRLGSAFGGVLTGLALVIAAIGLLAWNEGRSVQSIRTNKEGANVVASVSADSVLAANDGRLIHVSAPASAEGLRRDPALGIELEALTLARSVEYYQWVETSRSEKRTRLGGGEETVTTYSYDRQWTATAQDSSTFQQPEGHHNPTATIKNAAFPADAARIGAFTVDQNIVSQVPATQPAALTAAQAAAAAAALGRPVSAQEQGLYVGADPATPVPGDMRVTYTLVPQNQVISIIGAQSASSIRAYPTRAGSEILMVRSGPATAEQMFAQAQAGNQMLSWALRGVGVVVLIAAFGMVLAPLGVLADVVPLFGSIVRMGTGLVAGVTGVAVGAVVIAGAWIVYRPIVAVILLALVAALVGFLVWRARQAKARVAVAAS